MGTITKALNLLNYFSEHSPELGLMEFKKLTGQDKATVHRHLTELEANGFLEQNEETRKYRLGGAILRLSTVRETTFPARRIVTQWVNRLSQELGELVHASLLQNEEMSPLCSNDGGAGGTRVYYSAADMLPLHATASGIATLAFGPPELLDRVLNSKRKIYTGATITDDKKLIDLVSSARKKGYAFSDQAFELEVSSFAAPFFEKGAHAYGAIAVALPSSRLSKFNENELAQRLWQTSEAISNALGGNIPVDVRETWRTAA